MVNRARLARAYLWPEFHVDVFLVEPCEVGGAAVW
jgi:hypothetical protein